MTIKKRNKMRAILIILLFTVIHLGNRSIFAQGSVLPEKRILVLLSSEANRPIQILFNSTFRQEMNRRSFHPYEVNYENLDLVRFRDKNYKNNLKKILDRKYSVHRPDIIIIYLPHAARFVAEYNLFPGIPKIYITPQLTNKSKAQLPGNSVFGYLGFDFRGNVKHSLELFPDTNKMFVIRGETTSAKRFEKLFKKGTEEFTNQVAFEYISGLEVEKLLSRVENLPDRSLVYYLPYSKDTLGRRYYATEIAEQLGQRANRPVFSFMDLLVINTGILGGRVTSVESVATWAAEVVWRVLKGEDINSIEDTDFGYKYLYNWPKLKKWGLNEKRLPPNSVIYHRKYTFFELYKWQIFGGVLLLLFESLLILILFANINRRKKAEVQSREYQAELKESELRFRSTFEQAAVGIAHVAPDGRFLRINQRFCDIVRYTPGEMSEFTFQDITHPDDLEADLEYVRQVLSDEIQTFSIEKRYFKKNGSIVWINLTVSLVRESSGEPKYFITIVEDITERKQIEEALRESEKQIKTSLKEKEALLSEVHHRVKNNMQVIISLLKLQADKIEDKKYADMLKESQNRILSMAIVHEQLYMSKDFANIDFDEYVKSFMSSLFISHGVNTNKVRLNIDIKDVSLDLENAIPCGLIINELVSNSLKHAFPEEREGEIAISVLAINEDDLELTVSDDGVGIPENLDIRNTESMGLHIVKILAEQTLEGKIELNRTEGTQFHFLLKRAKYKPRI